VSNSTLESWLPRSCRPEQDSCQCGAREGGERAEPGATTAAVGVTYWATEFERVYLMTAARIRGKRALIQRDVPASTSGTAPRPSAWWDKAWIKQIVDTATALLFAGLAPALVMAALWRTTKIAPTVFAITFAIALGHAVFLGLPLFLILRSRRWINVMSCVVFGFAIGAAPAGVLSWPVHHPELHTSGPVDGVPTIFNRAITAAGGVSYVKPLIYFGSLGVLSGFAFWASLISSGTLREAYRQTERTKDLPRRVWSSRSRELPRALVRG
jgi:hypothetical protein